MSEPEHEVGLPPLDIYAWINAKIEMYDDDPDPWSWGYVEALEDVRAQLLLRSMMAGVENRQGETVNVPHNPEGE